MPKTKPFGFLYGFSGELPGDFISRRSIIQKYVFTNNTQAINLFQDREDIIFYADSDSFPDAEVISTKGKR